MQKVMKYSKRILSVVLALILTLAYLPMFSIESEAAATSYKWRVTVYVNKGTKHTSAGNVTIYWKTANGTSSSGSLQLYSGSGSGAIWQNDGTTATYVSDSSISGTVVSGVPANAFPYKATATITMKKTTTISKLQWKVKIEVLDANNNVLTDTDYSAQEEHTTGVANGNTYTATDEIGTGYYPYVTSLSISPSTVNVADTGSTAQQVTLSPVDNYGVNWVNAPTAISATNGVSVSSQTTNTPTLTFYDKLADYSSEISATYSSSNSSNSSKILKSSIAVKVTRTLTFDNLFDYRIWRRNGITSGNCSVTNISNDGFTLTTTSGNDGYCNWSHRTTVSPSTTYTVSADITGSGYQIFAETLDSSGNHIEYYNVTDKQALTFTTESNCGLVAFRFDSNNLDNTITVKNIRLTQTGTGADSVNPAGLIVSMGNKFADYTAPIPTKNGYSFAGWYWNGSLSYDSTGKWVFEGYADLGIGGYSDVADGSGYRTDFVSSWNLVDYTVTFVDTNGNTVATDTYTIEDTSITIPSDKPTKTGYGFSHWVVDTTSGNWTAGATVESAISGKYGNVKVKPALVANEYEIAFNSNGGSEVSNITGHTIEKTLTLPSPTKEAYVFKGWEVLGAWGGATTAENEYLASLVGTVFAPGYSQSGIYGSYSLRAVWEPAPYTIKFDSNGGSAVGDITYTIEDTVTLPEPTKTGYTFDGWYAKEAVGNWPADTKLPSSGTGVWGNVTLVARWTPTKHAITFIDWDDTLLKEYSADYDSQPTPPANPERPADNWYTYEFSAWNPVLETVTGAATYKAEYTATLIPYTITLDANSGTVSSTEIGYNGETTSVTLPDAEKTGYTFTGWTVKSSVGSWTVGTGVKGEITLNKAWGNVSLTANYTANNYTVVYDANGGALNDETDNKLIATFDSAITSLNQNLTRTGYTFAGWNTKADGSGDSIVVGETVWTYTDVDRIYAQWTPVSYTITFSVYDNETGKFNTIADAPEAITYTIEDDLSTILPRPVIDGYNFDSYMVWNTVPPTAWGTMGDIVDLSTLTTGKYGTVELVITYNLKEYTVTFYDEDGTTVLGTQTVKHGKTPVYNGTPTKAPTEQYSYDFAGWTPEVVPATGDASYTATYTQKDREYTIKFVSDGKVISTQSLKYGAMPEIPEDPEKEDSAEFDYTFAQWDNEVVAVTGDATYTAVFSWVTREYTITWIVDGKETTTTVKYGDTPEYNNGAEPTKDKTAEYTYTFTGWSPAITSVTGEATYTAQFSADKNSYTVVFKNWDGTVLDTQSLEHGSTPVYAGENQPARPADVQYTYTFAGWDPEIDTVTGDAIYTAKYDTTLNEYAITFVDEDGTTVLQTGKWEYGSTPEYSGETPTKAATAKYTYTFDGWTAAIAEVTGDATYTVKYKATINKYTITFVDEDGTTVLKTDEVEYDAMPTAPNDPTKQGNDQYSYTFAGWTPEVVTVTDDATYKATYTQSVNKYTVKFVNWNDEVIQSAEVEYGTVPAQPENNPARPADVQYTYTFAGWDATVVAVTGDVTYKATYTETLNQYTVTFKNWDGTVLQSGKLNYGVIPTAPADPSRPATAQYTYSFAGWKSEGMTNPVSVLPAVSGDVTYTADYSSVVNTYDVTFVDYDGTQIGETQTVKYGEMPVKPADPAREATAQYSYSFAGWSPAVTEVTGDATYMATYTETVRKYTVTFYNEDGTVLQSGDLAYGATPEYTGETPTKNKVEGVEYVFSGWSTTAGGTVIVLPTVTGKADYYAVYIRTDIELNVSYTTEWENADNATALGQFTYNTPASDLTLPATVDKAATDKYTYEFIGWNIAPGKEEKIDLATYKITADTVFYPAYKVTINKYSITFKNEDGSVLQSTQVEYDATPSYTGETPVKTGDAQYSYTFSGWTPAVVPVKGEATYTAEFTQSVNKYTVTFVDYDNNTLKTETLEYGKMPTAPADPTRPADVQYTYTFAGWDTEIVKVTGDVTYTATYDSTVNKYLVKFVNEDGTVLQEGEVAYGETPAYTGNTPTKTGDVQYSYTFKEWSPAIKAVDGVATYTATFTQSVNEYTIKFVNDDGTVLQESKVPYGTKPVYSGDTPEKEATAQYTFTFDKWDAEIVEVKGNATYTANFSSTVNKYVITFINDDGTELQKSEWEYGTTPVYSGATPEKAPTAQYTYTFKDWGTIAEVTGTATYTATYTSTVNKYTIKFVNDDGTVLQEDVLEYGAMPEYNGDTPTKAATAKYTYTFDTWDNEIESVGGNATYTATYTFVINEYTITFKNEDGTVLQSTKVAYDETPVYSGVTPEKTADAQYTYTHSGWTPAVVPVNGDAIYTATYSETLNKYTITWITGTDTYTGEWYYGETPDPAANGVDTSKESTVSTDFTFKSWDKDVVSVDGEATYTAVYTETTRKYAITWVVDGVSTVVDVEYGTVPVFDGTPEKESTVEHEYEFASWDVTPVAVVGTATYTAIFTETVRKYTVTWITGTGTYTGSWEYGTTPDPETDEVDTSKSATPQYVFTFDSWDKAIGTVSGDVTYTAVYTEAKRSYTVTYVVDNEVAYEEVLEWGASFHHPEIPSKEGHDAYWNVGFMTMPTQNITVEAVYTVKKYTVTWVADGATVYTEQVEFMAVLPDKSVPVKVGHSGVWDFVPETMPAGDVTITAVYTPNNYTVSWNFAYGSGTGVATYGIDFETTFNIAILPVYLRVTVGGVEITEEFYSYDNTTGALFIVGTAITGHISISEKAAEGYQNVVISVSNAVLSNNSSIVEEGQAYHTQVIPADGYLLPEYVTIYINGIEIYDGFSYDNMTGRLTINADVMTGELTISVECPVDPDYDPTIKDCDCNCHGNAFVQFFFKIITLLRKLFGMTQFQYCDCGVAHW